MLSKEQIAELRTVMHTRDLTCIELHNILDTAEGNLSGVELAEIAVGMKALQEQADKSAQDADKWLMANMKLQTDLAASQERITALRNSVQQFVAMLSEAQEREKRLREALTDLLNLIEAHETHSSVDMSGLNAVNVIVPPGIKSKPWHEAMAIAKQTLEVK